MRKTFSHLLYITILTVCVLACNSADPGKEPDDGSRPCNPRPAEKAPGIIDRNDARQLVKKFQEKYPDIETKAAWFDKTVIKLLYDSLYKTPDRFDGVRVYLGAYPPGFAQHREYDNRVTVFMVPTRPLDTCLHQPCNCTTHLSVDTFIFKKEVTKGLNHGELCPNYCDSVGNLHLGQ